MQGDVGLGLENTSNTLVRETVLFPVHNNLKRRIIRAAVHIESPDLLLLSGCQQRFNSQPIVSVAD